MIELVGSKTVAFADPSVREALPFARGIRCDDAL
jgi:hypothetical protein